MVRSHFVLKSCGMTAYPSSARGICNNYSSVFNTVYNINTGGGFGGVSGFWGGLGLGLGQGLSCLFGGFGNMFGGFGLGFGNMFGGLGNMFGGFGLGFGNMFGGLYNMWGGSSGRSSSNGSTCHCNCGSKTTSTEGSGNLNGTQLSDCGDIDSEKIAGFLKELEALEKAASPNQAKLDDLYKRVKEAKADSDSIHKADDDKQYDYILGKLKNLGAKDGVDNIDNINDDGNDDDDTVLDPSKITTLDALNKIPDADFNKITKDQAVKILTQLGYIENGEGKMSNNYRVLLLLEKSGINVKVEYREQSRDRYIKGPIKNVSQDSENKLSYTVNCADTGLAYKKDYQFKSTNTENTKFKVALVTERNADGSVKTTAQEDNDVKVAGIEVEYSGEKSPLLNKSGKVLVSKKK